LRISAPRCLQRATTAGILVFAAGVGFLYLSAKALLGRFLAGRRKGEDRAANSRLLTDASGPLLRAARRAAKPGR